LFFLLGYPLLFLYRWKLQDGCLSLVAWPLGGFLNLGVAASLYWGLAYGLLVIGSPFAWGLTTPWLVLGPLFALLYFPLLAPLLGVSRTPLSLGQTLRVFLGSSLGGVAGFYLGFLADRQWGTQWPDKRFLIWLGILLAGAVLGTFLLSSRKGAKTE